MQNKRRDEPSTYAGLAAILYAVSEATGAIAGAISTTPNDGGLQGLIIPILIGLTGVGAVFKRENAQ